MRLSLACSNPPVNREIVRNLIEVLTRLQLAPKIKEDS